MASATTRLRLAAAAHGEPDARPVLEQALAVCLKHRAFIKEHSIALRLLSVSQRLAALVASCCRGALGKFVHVTTPQRADALTAWLARNGALLHGLELWLDAGRWPPQTLRSSSAALAAALPHGLTQLLLLAREEDDDDDAWAAHVAEAVAGALTRRPGPQLCALELHGWASRSLCQLLPALACQTQLTRLVLTLPAEPSPMLRALRLPPWLVELECQPHFMAECDDIMHNMSELHVLAVAHMTRLTRLAMERVVLDDWDKVSLPTSLEQLVVADVWDGRPLTALTALSRLQLMHATEAAMRLAHLSALERLEVSVTFRDPPSGDGLMFYDWIYAAEALAQVRLTQLNIVQHGARTQVVTAHSLGALGRCRHLTQLQMCGFELDDTITATTLADVSAALAQLHALRELRLLDDAQHPEAQLAGLMATIKALPELQDCSFTFMPLGRAAAQLAAATQLTSLTLCDCGGVDDATVAAIVRGATRLQYLNLQCTAALSDACLEAIAAARPPQLRQMWTLGVSRFSQQALRALTRALPQLQVVAADATYQRGISDRDWRDGARV